MTATGLGALGWLCVIAATRFSVLARRRRRAGELDTALAARSWAMVTALAGVALGIVTITVAYADPAYAPQPTPTPQPTCAQTVDFPDAVPPRHGVCVSTEEAG